MPSVPTASYSLADLVEEYKEDKRPEHIENLSFYTEQKTLAESIRLAASAEQRDGLMQSHQRRLGWDLCMWAADELVKHAPKIKKCKTFDDLHDCVAELTVDISGFGPLAIYDTALRIGARLGKWPQKVYLHCGSLEGAKALGLPTRRKILDHDDVPDELRYELEPHEIENFFCWGKDWLTPDMLTK